MEKLETSKNGKRENLVKIGNLWFKGKVRERLHYGNIFLLEKNVKYGRTNQFLRYFKNEFWNKDNLLVIRYEHHDDNYRNLLKNFKEEMGIKSDVKAVNEIKKQFDRLKSHGFNIPPIDYILTSDLKERETDQKDGQKTAIVYLITKYVGGSVLNAKKNPVEYGGILDKYINYLKESFEKKLPYWDDFRIDQFKLGKLRGDKIKKPYMIDIDPLFRKSMTKDNYENIMEYILLTMKIENKNNNFSEQIQRVENILKTIKQ